jgi:ribosomal protein S18 acetylase RimI-like enzyme
MLWRFTVPVRPFHRSDREQLTHLVNAHVAAVVPGLSVSVNAVLSQLEREPGEYVVDPWVVERVTLVAEHQERVVAAAHLLRYGASDRVGAAYRDAGEIRWLLFFPHHPTVATELMAACLTVLDRWRVARRYADGGVPAPGVYGVPEQWPHVRDKYLEAGFIHIGQVERVYLAQLADCARLSAPPIEGLLIRRSVGVNGTRLAAVRGAATLGYIEVGSLDDAGRLPGPGGWADVGNLHVEPEHRRRRVATWLVGEAAHWLRLGRAERLLEYAVEGDDDYVAFLATLPFVEVTRTSRCWSLT